MPNVGNLRITLSVASSAFERGMKRSRAALKGFSDRIGAVRRRIMSFQGAFLALAAGGGFGYLLKQSADTIDSLAKTSDKLGVTTKELASLRHGAKLSGVETKTLDTALQRMTRRMAEAAKGTGEAQGAIKELGLDAKKLSKAGPYASMLAIADAMAKVENKSDKVRIAFKLFDSEGVGIVNMLQGGSGAFREWARDADKLGLAVSRMDARQIELMNDQTYRLKSAFQGLSTEVLLRIGPYVGAIANQVAELVSGMRSARNEGVSFAEAMERAALAVNTIVYAAKLTAARIAANTAQNNYRVVQWQPWAPKEEKEARLKNWREKYAKWEKLNEGDDFVRNMGDQLVELRKRYSNILANTSMSELAGGAANATPKTTAITSPFSGFAPIAGGAGILRVPSMGSFGGTDLLSETQKQTGVLEQIARNTADMSPLSNG